MLMRPLTKILLLLALAIPSSATITLGAHRCDGDSTGSAALTTTAIDTTGASLVVLYVGEFGAAFVNPTDSLGNTWNKLTEIIQGSNRSAIFYAANPTVGASHTFSVGAAASISTAVCVAAFNGVLTVSPFDKQSTFANTFTSIQPGSVTPTAGQDGELMVTGLLECSGTFTGTAASGFTLLDEIPLAGGLHWGMALAYFVQPTAAAVNPTWTWGGANNNAQTPIATFKVATASGLFPKRRIL